MHLCGIDGRGGRGMQGEILKSGRDTLLVAIPLFLLLFVGLFRLDELIGRSKQSRRRSRADSRPSKAPGFPSDPDGTPLGPKRRSR